MGRPQSSVSSINEIAFDHPTSTMTKIEARRSMIDSSFEWNSMLALLLHHPVISLTTPQDSDKVD
jgi:hypothetical protein